ncbi:MAG: nitrous oxide-stimulated promoter family protein [Ignavibacteriae bacterium]|nr:nitrous oxide-stimulated promoter family protein [Ignavibacteriota bacterium]
MEIKKKLKTRRIKLEQKTVERMISIYCKENHGSNGILCDECKHINDYAVQRLLCCPFLKDKPVCSNCTVHCYEPETREKVKEVMRYAGPKMILKHPYLAIMHLINEKKHTNSSM